MDIYRRAKGPLSDRIVHVGGLVTTFAISTALFARDHWKGGIFLGLWAPAFFRLADSLREDIERRR